MIKVEVKVPEVEGYTADKKTVTATVGEDGKIATNEKVEYKENKKLENGNNCNNNHANGNSN